VAVEEEVMTVLMAQAQVPDRDPVLKGPMVEAVEEAAVEEPLASFATPHRWIVPVAW
jgi:hypothetical protein